MGARSRCSALYSTGSHGDWGGRLLSSNGALVFAESASFSAISGSGQRMSWRRVEEGCKKGVRHPVQIWRGQGCRSEWKTELSGSNRAQPGVISLSQGRTLTLYQRQRAFANRRARPSFFIATQRAITFNLMRPQAQRRIDLGMAFSPNRAASPMSA
jgi:hypothetical protein